jgi:hypothetical protein
MSIKRAGSAGDTTGITDAPRAGIPARVTTITDDRRAGGATTGDLERTGTPTLVRTRTTVTGTEALHVDS